MIVIKNFLFPAVSFIHSKCESLVAVSISKYISKCLLPLFEFMYYISILLLHLRVCDFDSCQSLLPKFYTDLNQCLVFLYSSSCISVSYQEKNCIHKSHFMLRQSWTVIFLNFDIHYSPLSYSLCQYYLASVYKLLLFIFCKNIFANNLNCLWILFYVKLSK